MRELAGSIARSRRRVVTMNDQALFMVMRKSSPQTRLSTSTPSQSLFLPFQKSVQCDKSKRSRGLDETVIIGQAGFNEEKLARFSHTTKWLSMVSVVNDLGAG